MLFASHFIYLSTILVTLTKPYNLWSMLYLKYFPGFLKKWLRKAGQKLCSCSKEPKTVYMQVVLFAKISCQLVSWLCCRDMKVKATSTVANQQQRSLAHSVINTLTNITTTCKPATTRATNKMVSSARHSLINGSTELSISMQ